MTASSSIGIRKPLAAGLTLLAVAGLLAVACTPRQATATRASVTAAATKAARESGPTSEDTEILDVEVGGAETTITASGTVIDDGDIVSAPAGFGATLMATVFSRTTAQSVTLIWGARSDPDVRVRYDRAQWESAGAGAGDERFFTAATSYRWLDESSWRDATGPSGAVRRQDLPLASGRD